MNCCNSFTLFFQRFPNQPGTEETEPQITEEQNKRFRHRLISFFLFVVLVGVSMGVVYTVEGNSNEEGKHIAQRVARQTRLTLQEQLDDTFSAAHYIGMYMEVIADPSDANDEETIASWRQYCEEISREEDRVTNEVFYLTRNGSVQVCAQGIDPGLGDLILSENVTDYSVDGPQMVDGKKVLIARYPVNVERSDTSTLWGLVAYSVPMDDLIEKLNLLHLTEENGYYIKIFKSATEDKPEEIIWGPEEDVNVYEREELDIPGDSSWCLELHTQLSWSSDPENIAAETVIAIVICIGVPCLVYLYLRKITNEDMKRKEEENGELFMNRAGDAKRLREDQAAFLANMSHEIRTPMNGVLGNVDLLLGSPLTEDQKDLVEQLAKSGRTLLELVNDILDFSRIEANQMPIHPESCDVEDFFSDIVTQNKQKATERGIVFNFSIDDGCPFSINIDPDRFRQIVVNICDNAIKFTEEGKVDVFVKYEEKNIVFAVADTGIGLMDDDKTTIFLKFRQADSSSTRKHGGTGLGLAITKRLVDLMEGKIFVDSQVGEGTTFTVKIPASIVSMKALKRPSVTRAITESDRKFEFQNGKKNNAHVLVVEDNIVNQKVAKGMLTKLGCTVDIAPDGVEGLKAAKNEFYHIIFMDAQMPRMDGYEATQQIRASKRIVTKDVDDESESDLMYLDLSKVPIIGMTAHAHAKDKQKCLNVGMTDYLPKPISLASMETILRRWLWFCKEQSKTPTADSQNDHSLLLESTRSSRTRSRRCSASCDKSHTHELSLGSSSSRAGSPSRSESRPLKRHSLRKNTVRVDFQSSEQSVVELERIV